METDLAFDFTVDKATSTVFVTKEFAVGQASVWDAFTKAEILDQWWAPKPWQSQTKSMDFKIGGRRLYAMVGPEGQKQWSIQDFTAISPMSHFEYSDAFANDNGNISNELPSSEWDLDFNTTQSGTTKVNITIRHQSADDLEKLLQMGFKEGFTATLNSLGSLLQKADPE